MSTVSAVSRPRAGKRRGRFAATVAALLVYGAFSASAFAMQDTGTGVSGASVPGTRVLEAADHADLRAEISASGVVRIALAGDRIARAVRGAGGFGIEHEPANGDLYLRPLNAAGGGADRAVAATTATLATPAARPVVPAPAAGPRVLFIGTERGFTYRLTLVPVAGGPAQVLIRNPAAEKPAASATTSTDTRIGALVRLIRAVARREPLAGHAIHAGPARTPIRAGPASGTSVPGLTVIETWRGSRFAALVFEAAPSASPGSRSGAGEGAGLAGTIGGLPGLGRVAALWLAAPGTGPSGGRLAVAVVEDTRAGDTRAGDATAADPRHAGDNR